ncbi:hypothetical protein RRF57_001254 [Xylaria bambusicola]|uniref:Uncharacterized protein n=1 Tax=Xylaria bambusicola TaxID=326684 RepID=A0AAN7Z3C1_9PEZI
MSKFVDFLGTGRRLPAEFGVGCSCKESAFKALEAAPKASGDGAVVASSPNMRAVDSVSDKKSAFGNAGWL